MRNNTFSICKSIIVMLLLFSCKIALTQTTIGFYDFENGLQGWTDGGNDAGLSNSSYYSCFGNRSIYSKDDQENQNRVTSPILDFTPYSNITISFCSKNNGLENGEGFKLEYYDGSTWSLLYTFKKGVDFSVSGYSSYDLVYTFASDTYSFSTNSRMRFSSTANQNSEYNYFDNILIEGIENEPEVTIQDFYDSDGDGVYDDVDIDDDNDGILDSDEELSCKNSAISTYVNYKFLNETFGTGTNRTTINTTYDAQTSYCYEDGSGSCNSNQDLNDGEYTVYHKAGDGDGTNDTPNNEVASWADEYWYSGLDHTSGDTNGRMAMFNASYDPGLFYTAHIQGALPNVPITYSFWVINLDNHDAPGISSRLRPDILVEFRDGNGNILNSLTTGSIPPNNPASANNGWINFTADLTFNVDEFYVYFFNNETGGLGNDLALDDIVISQTLCDTDGDGVADIFDLDSDNDGIPDVVEAGLGAYSEGKATLTNVSTWVDINGNGMHDLVEGHIPLDSDGDGIPNYLDLDSDNDTLFDVDESGAGNLADTSFQNGDGDINGDGVGDGTDTDAVRETDVESDGIVEYFTDGILDLYDYYNGSTFEEAYGNSNQGIGYTYYVKDTDGDGLPDYMDTDSNDDGIYDIASTLYYALDTNNDGVIDDMTDLDSDGIMDLFDTDDNLFGSPRDLNQKLLLYFDGRNDYVEDTQILSGLSDVSFMTWIKIDPTFTGRAIILGQANFELEVENYGDVTITAHADNKQFSIGDIPLNQWVHVAATTSSSTNQLVLYINGENRGSVNGIGGSLNTNTYNFTIGKSADPADSDTYFKGFIDEVRIFTKTLSDDEIHKMVYQEIGNNAGNVRGEVIPRDITDFVDVDNNSPLSWSFLLRYYRMDVYKDDIIDDLTTPGFDTVGAKIYNVKHICNQTAPLPFITQHGNDLLPETLDIPEDGVNGYDATTYDWSIIKVLHNNISYNENSSHLAFYLGENDSNNDPIEFSIENDSEFNVSWYLKLDGLLDLTGESQLVQGLDSELDTTSTGRIEIDQQGTKDLFTYNYWSSPVGLINTTINNMEYHVPDVLFDGSDPDEVQEINFISGYNGNSGSPISIAHYWIWKFNNFPTDDYASWQHVRNTGTMYVGEGYTMKGVANTNGNVSEEQNYVFVGKPNNGDIALTINENNDYLVGNPYPSAIDVVQFILDNGSIIEGNGNLSGTLYFWEHWGGGSHILAEYQGGYATYNLSGGAPSASYGTNDPDVGTGGVPTKIPGRYIPVGQGFFVIGESDGQIKFNNGQRVFRKEENGVSVFVKQANPNTNVTNDEENPEDYYDTRLKIRLGYNSVNTIHRQLLVTEDPQASAGIDWGYEGILNENQMDDMFWQISDDKFVIQGIDVIDEATILPIGIKTDTQGINTIMIDALENVPDDLNIYLYDSEQNLYHDLRVSNFSVTLGSGNHLNRFELRFSAETLSMGEDTLAESLSVFYANDQQEVVIYNPKLWDIQTVEIYNTLGQSVYQLNNLNQEEYSKIQSNNLSQGAYIISVSTKLYGTFNKKVIIK